MMRVAALGVFLVSVLSASPLAADSAPGAVDARTGAMAAGVADRAMDSVLVLYSDDGAAVFLGSGFVWGDGRHVVTNAHVTGEAARVVIEDRRGRRQSVPVVARDRGRDIAVLRLSRARIGLVAAPRPPGIGSPVIALGAPMGLGFTATSGIVAAAPRQVEPTVPMRLVQHDAALNPGSSGGPLIDDRGQLLGMNSRIADGSRLFFGIAYAIPAGDLARLVPALLAGSLPPLPALGLDLRPLDGRIAAALGVPPVGLLVDDVLEGGPADGAGLRPGDILLNAAGRRLETPGDLAFALDGAGPRVGLRLRRDGQVIALHVAIAPGSAAVPGDPVPRPARSLADLSVGTDTAGRVTALAPDSAAARAGLSLGDRLLRLNGRAYTADMLRGVAGTGAFVLLVAREGRHLHLIVDPGAAAQAGRPVGGGNRLDLAVVRF